MEVTPHFPVGAWYRSRRKNGWMMMDLLLAMTLVVLTLTAFLPLVSQTVRLDRKAHIQETLLRQAVSIEATLFQKLWPMGMILRATSDSLQFKTPLGRKKGFIIHRETLFGQTE